MWTDSPNGGPLGRLVPFTLVADPRVCGRRWPGSLRVVILPMRLVPLTTAASVR